MKTDSPREYRLLLLLLKNVYSELPLTVLSLKEKNATEEEYNVVVLGKVVVDHSYLH